MTKRRNEKSQISVNTYVNQIPIKTNKCSDHIVIKHINAQSLIPKLDKIKLLIENEDLDILCVSETWLQPNILDALISIKNYNIFRNDNPLNSRGSEACIYVKNIFTRKKYENIEITDGGPSKGFDDVWVSIQASKFKYIIVGAVHKHPNTNADCIAYLERMLQTYSNCRKNMCMLGDLNGDLLKVNRLEKILKRLNLNQLIKKPTRITPRSKTLIDVIITNNRDTVIHAETSLSIADHHAISCTINL